jgi:translocator protein
MLMLDGGDFLHQNRLFFLKSIVKNNIMITTQSNKLSSQWKFIIAVFICEAVGIVSGLLTQQETATWFSTLEKPTWNPPAYLFGPVWTTLYLLMGISLWLIWKCDAPETQKLRAELTFAVQLFLNFMWSILFFKCHSPLLAFIDILLMIVVILMTIGRFARMSKLAAWLLIPYLAWVCFATVLNYNIWLLNPT